MGVGVGVGVGDGVWGMVYIVLSVLSVLFVLSVLSVLFVLLASTPTTPFEGEFQKWPFKCPTLKPMKKKITNSRNIG